MSICPREEDQSETIALEESKGIVELCVDQFSGGNIFELTSWIQRELKGAGLRAQSQQFGSGIGEYLKTYEDYDTAIDGIRNFPFT